MAVDGAASFAGEGATLGAAVVVLAVVGACAAAAGFAAVDVTVGFVGEGTMLGFAGVVVVDVLATDGVVVDFTGAAAFEGVVAAPFAGDLL